MNIYIVLVIQLLIASGTHVVAKSVLQHIDALPLTFFRGVLSAAGFSFLVFCRRKPFTFLPHHRKRIAFLGFLAVLNQFLYLYALKFTTAANGALLYATTPIFVLMFSRYVTKEHLSKKKVIGIVLAFTGVALIVVEKGVSFRSEYMYGNFIMILAVICWALYTTLGKSFVMNYGALNVSAFVNIVGFAVITPFGLLTLPTVHFDVLTTMDIVGLFYLGFGTSIISYLLWYYALGHIDASSLAVFMNGQPVVATLLSVVFLDYTVSTHFFVGGVVTLLGVLLTQTKST